MCLREGHERQQVGFGIVHQHSPSAAAKGPQGTLFGRNATGGAVLYTSKRPTDEFSAYAKVGYGSYDDRLLEAAINAPLPMGSI